MNHMFLKSILGGLSVVAYGSIVGMHSPLRDVGSRDAFSHELLHKSLHGLEPLHLTCMTYNMCNNPNDAAFSKDASGDLYRKYRWSARVARMTQLIQDEKPDIIGFQEIRDDRDVRALPELWKHLGAQGYELINFRNNASPGSLSNVIAYNPQRVTLHRINRYWSSETPDENSDSWGNGWGRVNLVATFYPSAIKEVRGRNINGPDYDHPPLHYVNVHNGLAHTEKLESNKVHVAQAKQLLSESPGIVIVGGDFNNFNDDGGPEEMAIFDNAQFCDLAKPLKTAEGVTVSGTFPGFEYDPYRSPAGTFGAHLDHMECIASLPDHTITFWSYVNAKRYDGATVDNAQTESELLQEKNGLGENRDFPSDHLPVIVHLLIARKPV